MWQGGSTAKEQEDFTEEVTEVGFEGCLGVSQEDKVWIGVGKGFFLVKKTVFSKAWRQEIVTCLGNCK